MSHKLKFRDRCLPSWSLQSRHKYQLVAKQGSTWSPEERSLSAPGEQWDNSSPFNSWPQATHSQRGLQIGCTGNKRLLGNLSKEPMGLKPTPGCDCFCLEERTPFNLLEVALLWVSGSLTQSPPTKTEHWTRNTASARGALAWSRGRIRPCSPAEWFKRF